MAKTLRLIVTTNDYAEAANIGGPAVITYRTFDVPCPEELTAFLSRPETDHRYSSRWVSGVEVREDGSKP